MVSYRSLGIALAVSALISTPTLAQEASPEAEAPPTAEPGESDAIIVTARRRNESIQTTPVAVTAVNAAMLENMATTNLTDLQGSAPNTLITTQSTGAATANISIRGIAFPARREHHIRTPDERQRGNGEVLPLCAQPPRRSGACNGFHRRGLS
jgi:iron complex outermembrane recepter protein